MCYVDSNPAAVKKLLVTPKHSYRLEPIPFILTEIFEKREEIVFVSFGYLSWYIQTVVTKILWASIGRATVFNVVTTGSFCQSLYRLTTWYIARRKANNTTTAHKNLSNLEIWSPDMYEIPWMVVAEEYCLVVSTILLVVGFFCLICIIFSCLKILLQTKSSVKSMSIL